jgi:hypothetical protein
VADDINPYESPQSSEEDLAHVAEETEFDTTPPRLPPGVVVVDGAVMLGILLGISYTLAKSWRVDHWIGWVFGGTISGLLVFFFGVMYGAALRRRQWMAAGGGSCFAILSVTLLGVLPTYTPTMFVSSPELGWLFVGCAVPALAASFWGWVANSRWAGEVAEWEGRCHSAGEEGRRIWEEHGFLPLSRLEVLLFALSAGLVCGATRAMVVLEWV